MSNNAHAHNSSAPDLENHSPEGINILYSEPARKILNTLYLLAALLLSSVVWLFIGKIDVKVTTQGTITPDSAIMRIYAPLDGQLIDIYINEGMSVKKGDLLARVHAPMAIQQTSSYLKAQQSLANIEKEFSQFIRQKKWQHQKAKIIWQRHLAQKEILERRASSVLTQVSEEHKLLIENQRIAIQKLSLTLNNAKTTAVKLEALYALPDKGGIKEQQLIKARHSLQTAFANVAEGKSKMSQLETNFNKQYNKEKGTLLQLEGDVIESGMQYENELASIKNEESRIKNSMQMAQLNTNAAAQAAPENIDENGFLKILSPYSGIVTEVPFSQPGDAIQINKPLAGIVPVDSKMIIEIQIAESKRAFLQEGQAVRLKVTAFAYQRYGVITGTLYFISPIIKTSTGSNKPFYKGHVKLDKTILTREGIFYPLQYGMTATADIIVGQKRIIDFILDPIRG